MFPRYKNRHLGIVILLIGIILSFHYFTIHDMVIRHAVYRMLFFIPLVLASFWFGLKGSIFVSLAIFLLYSPYLYKYWIGFYLEFERITEGALFIFMGCLLGYLSDKQKKEQEMRIKSERLAAIGGAVSEIAHDMKSPLMAIGGFTNQVTRNLAADEVNRKKLDLVIREISRMESMVREMLDFGRPFQLQKTQESLNEIVLECVELSLPLGEKSGVDIRTNLDPEIPLLDMDRHRIKQVIVNLITNAVQASPAGKAVWIRTWKRKDRVGLDVSDAGCGIKPEDQKRIFDPFFSSKKDGTGLGLAIVKKITDLHGGEIRLFSNPEGGVTFSMALPKGR